MTTSPARHMSKAMSGVMRAINRRQTTQEVLDALVAGAVEIFPEISHAGLSVAHRSGKIETLAATSDLVRQLDELQYTLHEGPCYEAIADEVLVLTEFARHEQRWPSYSPAAARLGLRAQVGLRLYTHDQTVGGLNLYSTTSDVVSDDSVAMAEVFASYVTAALQRAQTEDSMTTAMISRQVIGQATGIVMERFGLGDAEAFAYLRRTSSDTNVKLREIARRLTDGEIALPPPH